MDTNKKGEEGKHRAHIEKALAEERIERSAGIELSWCVMCCVECVALCLIDKWT